MICFQFSVIITRRRNEDNYRKIRRLNVLSTTFTRLKKMISSILASFINKIK